MGQGGFREVCFNKFLDWLEQMEEVRWPREEQKNADTIPQGCCCAGGAACLKLWNASDSEAAGKTEGKHEKGVWKQEN